jgi:hypothetical protein
MRNTMIMVPAGTSRRGEMVMDVQQHEESGTTYRVGQDVRRVDFENDGTPAYEGRLTRIEMDEDEVTYWITWEGATAPDAHGTYAFTLA